MIPSKPISRRSTPDTIGWLSVVGVFGDGSSAGISMCAVITAPAPAAMPALNGGNSVCVERLARILDDRQPEMRVDVGVAVPGKVLQRRDHAAGLQAADVGAAEAADRRGILAVRPRVDHRIARVVVDVDDRREVDLDADRARLDRGDPAGLVGELLVAGGAERHVARKRRRPFEAEAGAGLEVGGIEQRIRRDRLQAVEQRRRRQRLPERDGAVVARRAARRAPARSRRTRGSRRSWYSWIVFTSASNSRESVLMYSEPNDETSSCPTLSSSVIFFSVAATQSSASASSFRLPASGWPLSLQRDDSQRGHGQRTRTSLRMRGS